MVTKNTASDLFDFADEIALISSQILNYRIKNKPKLSEDAITTLEQLEGKLDVITGQVRARGIERLAQLTAQARKEVIDATAKAAGFLKKIKKIEKVVQMATALLGVGLAVIAGKPQGIVEAVQNVVQVAKGGDETAETKDA